MAQATASKRAASHAPMAGFRGDPGAPGAPADRLLTYAEDPIPNVQTALLAVQLRTSIHVQRTPRTLRLGGNFRGWRDTPKTDWGVEIGHRLGHQQRNPQYRLMERRSRIIRGIWAACLLFAGLNHARILLEHGLFWNYGGVGWASAAYWSSLTVIDPIAAALLFARPRIGILASAVLIVTNVVHNLATTARYTPEGEFLTRTVSSPLMISQIGFMLFVGATARAAWKGIQNGRDPLPLRTS